MKIRTSVTVSVGAGWYRKFVGQKFKVLATTDTHYVVDTSMHTPHLSFTSQIKKEHAR